MELSESTSLYICGDHSELDVGGYAIDNARPLILLPASKAPLGVSVRRSVQGPVYTNANGGVLYTFFCSVLNPAGEDGLSGAAVSAIIGMSPTPGLSHIVRLKIDVRKRWKPFIAPGRCQAKRRHLVAGDNPRSRTLSLAVGATRSRRGENPRCG